MNIFVGYQNIDSGAKIVTEHLLNSFKKISSDYSFFIYKQNPYKFIEKLSFTKNFIWSIWDFRKKLNSYENLDAIYSPYYLLYVAKILSKHKKIPFYFHLHGDQASTDQQKSIKKRPIIKKFYTKNINNIIAFIQKKTIKKSKTVFFVSKKAQKQFLSLYKISFNKNFIIVPNGISLKKFFSINKETKIKIKKKNIKNAKNFVLLYMGRIDYKKGILELIEAIKYLKNQQSISLIIVHPDIPDKYSRDYLNTLKKMAKSLSAETYFIKNPKNITEYYQMSDLVILPSYQEMMPLTMLEAFACGIPFIGSEAGNMPELIQKINPKMILKKIKSKEISKKIKWFMELPNTEKVLITTKQKNIVQKLAWGKSAEIIIQQLAKHQ